MENILVTARAVLTATPARWINLTETLPNELLARPPAASEWSAVECLQHLVDAERSVFPVRVRAILAGQDFPAYDPDRQGTKPDVNQSASELAREFGELRKDSLTLLAQLSLADLEQKARHAELGMVSLSELVNEWAGHDLMHTVQAERAMMQPFIQGCGPWVSYFADHQLKPR
jgi:DinB family protein